MNRAISLVLLGIVLIVCISGCRRSTAPAGQPTAEPKMDPVLRDQVAQDASESDNDYGSAPLLSDDPFGEEANPMNGEETASSNPLIQGLRDVLGSNPVFEGEEQRGLRQSLLDADRTLRQIKEENIAALRDLSHSTATVRKTTLPVPNIVLILADDLSMDDLGCYGQHEVPTPAIDALAAAGMRFTQAYTGSPNGDVTRWCILTGFDSSRAFPTRGAPLPLASEHTTLAESLWQAGFATAFIGRWGFGVERRDLMPHLHGFDEWLGDLSKESAANHYLDSIWSDGVQMRLPANAEGQRGQLDEDVYLQEALAFLDRHRDGKRFFLQLNVTLPGPPTASNEANEDAARSGEPRYQLIEHLDSDVGAIIKRLRDHALDERTMVVLTSDNAPFPNPRKENVANKLRAEPGSLYEGNLRVPLIACWRQVIPAGSVATAPVAACDWLPTLAELAAAKSVPRSLDGISIVPVLRGQSAPNRDMLYWEMREPGFTQAVRRGPWKVVRPAGQLTRDAVQLYNLETDPTESKNVAAENPDIVSQFIKP